MDMDFFLVWARRECLEFCLREHGFPALGREILGGILGFGEGPRRKEWCGWWLAAGAWA